LKEYSIHATRNTMKHLVVTAFVAYFKK